MTPDDNKIAWRPIKGLDKMNSSNPYISQMVKHYVLPNGVEKRAYTSHHNPFVVGLPITSDMDVILVREYRPGPDQIMLDLPSGSLHPNEDPTEGMIRELEEETGYTGTPELVNISFTSPYSNQERYTYLIRDCTWLKPQCLDHDEFIEVVKMPLRDFYLSWVVKGLTTNAVASFYALDRLGLLKVPF